MKNATVAIEDKRFYQHHGVDFTGIARALVDDIKAGHVVQGASTITEQYVKNAYIGADPTLCASSKRRCSPGSSKTAGPKTRSSPST